MSETLHALIIVAALILSAALGSPLVQLVFRLADRERRASKVREAAPGSEENTSAPEALRGGLTIGILERIAITGLLLASFPAGIAAIVAIKGLGRFHELKGPNGALASEKFVIGTLTSYVWAGLIAVIAIAIRSHI